MLQTSEGHFYVFDTHADYLGNSEVVFEDIEMAIGLQSHFD